MEIFIGEIRESSKSFMDSLKASDDMKMTYSRACNKLCKN